MKNQEEMIYELEKQIAHESKSRMLAAIWSIAWSIITVGTLTKHGILGFICFIAFFAAVIGWGGLIVTRGFITERKNELYVVKNDFEAYKKNFNLQFEQRKVYQNQQNIEKQKEEAINYPIYPTCSSNNTIQISTMNSSISEKLQPIEFIRVRYEIYWTYDDTEFNMRVEGDTIYLKSEEDNFTFTIPQNRIATVNTTLCTDHELNTKVRSMSGQIRAVYFFDKKFYMTLEQSMQFEKYYEKYNRIVRNNADKLHARIINQCNLLDDQAYYLAHNFLQIVDKELFLSCIYVTALEINSAFTNYNFDYNNQLLSQDIEQDELFSKFIDSFSDFSDILGEEYSINNEDRKYIGWELLKRAANKYYSNVWKDNYDSFLNKEKTENNYIDYIKMVVICNEINHKSDEIIAYLSYYFLEIECCPIEQFFPSIFDFCKKTIDEVENEVKKEIFRNKIKGNIEKKAERYTIDDVDMMNGNEFEHFVCNLFSKMGYSSEVTKQSGDQGLDVIAKRNDKKIGIQAKCYSNSVGNSAIQEAVAGKSFYNCDKVIVVTNNTFTSSAIELAKVNDVVLWDRSILKEKVIEMY